MSGAPKETVWSIEPHTQAKHAILEKYLQAWYPIMTSWNGRVIFLDGFAGPGEYAGGEKGSPLIALDTLLDHPHPGVRSNQVVFIFIEKDAERCEHLRELLAEREIPSFVKYQIYEGAFDETLTSLLDGLEERSSFMAPTFAFLDPFGYSDTPMRTIARLMRHPSCEVLINFVYENINRFFTFENTANQAHYDGLFGTNAWRSLDVRRMPPKERERRIRELYQDQLRTKAGATHVRSFRMRNKTNNTEYYLFFGTRNLKGLDKMKEAMWRVDPSGAYDFSDFTNSDLPVLFKPQADFSILKQMLQDRFSGQVATVRQVREYVIAETPFHSGQYKTSVLKPMENTGDIVVVQCPARRKAGTYSDEALDAIKLKFLGPV